MQWNVGRAETHPSTIGEYFFLSNRVFSFVLPLSREPTALECDWLSQSESSSNGNIVGGGLKMSKPPEPKIRGFLRKVPETFPARDVLDRDDFQAWNIIRSSELIGPPAAQGVSHEFHKVSSVLYIGSFTRPVKIGAFRRSPKAPSKSKSKLRHQYTAARTINPGRFSRWEMGLRDAAAATDHSNQLTWETYDRNFIKRGRKGSFRQRRTTMIIQTIFSFLLYPHLISCSSAFKLYS